MQTLFDRGDAATPSTLLIFLPPAMATIEDLIAHGVIDAVRARNSAADVMLAEITHEHVMQQRVVDTLREAVIAPALESGYRQIWIAGISLGAFNALHYAARFAADICGLCLLAPYPGTGDILREIEQAGGPVAWADSPDRSLNDERAWWYWLTQQSPTDHAVKPIYVGLSSEDRFRRGQQMLAQLIPADHVDTISGGHDWPAWIELWKRWLDKNLMNGSC